MYVDALWRGVNAGFQCTHYQILYWYKIADMPQKRRIPPIVWTVLYILFLAACAATSYAKTVDLVFMYLQLFTIAVASIVVVRMYWRHWHRTDNSPPKETLIQRGRDWFLDRNSTDRRQRVL